MTTLGVDSSVVCPTCVAETAVLLSEVTTLGGVTVELIDPDGNVIDAATPGYQQWQTSTREMQMLFETVDSSDAGTWQLRVSGNGQYAVNLFGSSALHMTSVGQHTARGNTPFQVGALITAEEGASCSGCTPTSVTLTLVGLDNTQTIPVTISGNTPPAVYGGSVTVSTPGLYRLMAEGVLENGSQFVRVDPTPIRVRAHGVSGSGDDSAVPGSTRSLSFELSNDGAAATFDLELFSEMGWTATDSIPDSVTLAAGESVVYTVNAVIPADAQIGSAEESVFVAVPQDDLSAVVSVSAKTAVVDYQRIFLPLVIR
ncbi:MAG: hypothetical protein KC419_12085, partial [Anaerolineales bacterium]|nr:hypothetical protein [Anaerolineales bacterium]